MFVDINNLKKGDSISVSELESKFSESLVNLKFSLNSSIYGKDTVILRSKKEGFGALFFSELFQKEFYLDSHILLKKED